MDIVRFVMKNDPWKEPRVGVPLPDDRGVVDLQSGHFSMYERPSPLLSNAERLRNGDARARELAERIVTWVVAQNPPGVVTGIDNVEFLDAVTE